MRAMILERTGPLKDNPTPLRLVDVPVPTPGHGKVLIKVHACGVCHTELDEIEGRLTPPALPVILGHQVVGEIQDTGVGVTLRTTGERVGVLDGYFPHAADAKCASRAMKTSVSITGPPGAM